MHAADAGPFALRCSLPWPNSRIDIDLEPKWDITRFLCGWSLFGSGQEVMDFGGESRPAIPPVFFMDFYPPGSYPLIRSSKNLVMGVSLVWCIVSKFVV